MKLMSVSFIILLLHLSVNATLLQLLYVLLVLLADDCRLFTDARERRLRSTASRTCVVMRTYSTFGDRAFSAAGSGLWNSLPSHLKTLTYRTMNSGGH